MCSEQPYAHLATFVSSMYRQAGSGRLLSCGTALNYLSILLNLAKERHRQGSAAAQLFLTYLDEGSRAGKAWWYRGLRLNMKKA